MRTIFNEIENSPKIVETLDRKTRQMVLLRIYFYVLNLKRSEYDLSLSDIKFLNFVVNNAGIIRFCNRDLSKKTKLSVLSIRRSIRKLKLQKIITTDEKARNRLIIISEDLVKKCLIEEKRGDNN